MVTQERTRTQEGTKRNNNELSILMFGEVGKCEFGNAAEK